MLSRAVVVALLCLGLLFAPTHATLAQAAPDFVLMRIKAGQARVHFVLQNFEKPGCPSPIPACQAKAYLIPGDIVVMSSQSSTNIATLGYISLPTAKGFAFATYDSPANVIDGLPARQHWGLLPVSRLEPAPLLTKPHDFSGIWVIPYDTTRGSCSMAEACLEINGQLSFRGNAQWSYGDGANIGSANGRLTLKAGEALYNGDPCQIRMARSGSELFVQDNGLCGGQHVTFTGVYRRMKS